LYPAECRVDLPIYAARNEAPTAFPPPEAARNLASTQLRAGRRERSVEEDATTGRTVVTINRDQGAYRLEADGLEFDGAAVERFTQVEGDPLSAEADIQWRYAMRRGDWAISTLSRTRLTGTKDSFHLYVTLDAFEDDRRIFTRSLSRDLPRVGL
jgi:hypothetical protein